MWKWTSQPHKLRSVCTWWPIGTHCLHWLELSETTGMETGGRKSSSLVRKTAVDTKENCRCKFSVTPGTYSKQRCRYRYKEVEQAKVILPSVWMWIGLHQWFHKGWCRRVCGAEWKDGEFQTAETDHQGDFENEHSHGYHWVSWACKIGGSSPTSVRLQQGTQTWFMVDVYIGGF